MSQPKPECFLFLPGSSEQLLSPDCWKAALRALGCGSPMADQGSFKKSDCTESPVLRDAGEILLSAEQVSSSLVDLLCSAAEQVSQQ